MKIEEAKFILHAYRPNGSDAGDATFDDALAVARRDPALAAWFARLQEFDRNVAAKLGNIHPPAGLRDSILAGARVSGAGGAVRAKRLRQPAWLALAASIAVAALLVWTFAPARADAASLGEFVAADVKRLHPHGQGGMVGALAGTLGRADHRLGSALAIDFEELRVTGCRTISFQGRDVLEVCFERDGRWFHCYIARRADFPAMEIAAEPRLSERAGVHLATWADNGHVFVVVSKAGREALQRLI